ncbi:WG repeat-containing protein [uncultured Rikenella sp.]|uniref:WG repeat-containing protein n=1 Tax=uncultured Rikenella sp. TaxID=368003 RepID=UPI0025F0D957|nr:WG repeat-containing protein [uncultured Rikenella sp.]
MKILIGWFGLLLGAGLNVLPLRAQQHRTERQNPITRSLHEGLAAVSPDGKQWGYADSTGRIVIRPRWSLVSDFYEGMARVVVADSLNMMLVQEIPHNIQVATPGKTGLIDRKGNYIVPLDYSYIDINRGEPYLRFNRGVYNPAGAESSDFRQVYPGCKWGLMDLRGNIVLPDTEYDYIWPLRTNGRYYYGVEKNGRYGVLEAGTWQWVVPWGDYASDEALYDRLKQP